MFDDIRVGNDAGWTLDFTHSDGANVQAACLSIGAGDYHADIFAALPGGLEGGSYRFAIEGITNEHYQRLHAAWASGRGRLHVDLYLYWRDTAGGPLRSLSNLAGLADTVDALSGLPADSARVARLVVTRLSRRVGARRYEALVEAREAVYEALSQALTSQPRPGDDPLGAAVEVAAVFKVDVQPHRLPDEAPPATKPIAAVAGTTGLRALADLDVAMAEHYRRSGRGMLLIRDGKLHVGPGRIPLAGAAPAVLNEAGGLVHIETAGASQSDANLAASADGSATSRQHYALTLKGRPDLRPGDIVTFVDPEGGGVTTPGSFADAVGGLIGSLAGVGSIVGQAVHAYVSGVSHHLSRTQGFVTTLAGVVVQPGGEWDEPTPTPWRGQATADPASTPDGAVVDAIVQMAGAPMQALAIGEVRAATPQSTQEPPAQTVDVWLGLAPGDGLPFRARRLPIDRDSRSRINGMPYVTPFAWGKCGLVLPRYPGTRVLVGHRGGNADDPLELGAVWESGHGPASLAGDWWLSLPAAVDTAARTSVGDDTTPAEPSGKASNDLTDADGARVIEVGRLTIRVLPTKLPEPGTRPAAPADAKHHVTIEHESGSRIVIADNGDITIESKGALTLKAATAMNISADEIKVKVTKTMDVSE